MLTLENFKEARKRLQPVINQTSLIYSEVFSKESNNEVYLKPENLQRTGSFKIRGAYNKVSKLSSYSKQQGLIASSAGNHAQGVALSAKECHIDATIVMPMTTPLIKVEATKQYGANVVLHGEVYDEAYQYACELQAKHNYTFIHPFNDEDVIEGQGTIALEIIEELNDVDIILVPIGGGGLISGIASAAKQINPNIRIVGVEPVEAASASEAINQNCIVCLDEVHTIADGTAVKEIGSYSFEYIKVYVDEIIMVSDYELMDAFLLLVEAHKLVAESSGLLSLAALKKLNVQDKKVVALISGGNIDVLKISSMINKGLIARGRRCTFIIPIQDKPGELQKLTAIFASLQANIVSLKHNKYKNLEIFDSIETQVTIESNGFDHVEHILKTFQSKGYSIEIK